ncbi:rRNA pseudouridine synthase [Mycoplasma phocoeninasale]|uniref:Pseudouridine synthase n=1 Tax=Mycoplasma phocoeninasale TaxID=2726117 RepID=A0A858U2H3_9MOLU|nr:pseudouridine synthase [Mycoplasma phocoeninasale]QJG66680.1 rRNA pseudouridine synthase [Mycoplasma phocoeninasale]
MEEIKIQKLISFLGYCSRREAEKLVEQGKVYVNGELAKIGMRVTLKDLIQINGKILVNKQKNIYLLLNKPKNTICSLNDPQGRKTIYQHIKMKDYAYSVGRLDFNTTGVIIITNDGDFANMLAHPSSEIKREYIAELESPLEQNSINYLNSNFVKLNGKFSRQVVKHLKDNKYLVILKEGRNHHVKNLFALVNNRVVNLHRKSFAFLSDKGLKIGEFRDLTFDEISQLKKLHQVEF